jgi:hypothetical protein
VHDLPDRNRPACPRRRRQSHSALKPIPLGSGAQCCRNGQLPSKSPSRKLPPHSACGRARPLGAPSRYQERCSARAGAKSPRSSGQERYLVLSVALVAVRACFRDGMRRPALRRDAVSSQGKALEAQQRRPP